MERRVVSAQCGDLAILRASSVRLSRRLNMLVKSQKLVLSQQNNLTFRAFSPREAYHEGSVKSVPHLRESRFLAAIFPPSHLLSTLMSVHCDVTNIRQ